MAEYVRFEVYIPVHYTVTKRIKGGKQQKVMHALDEKTVIQFIRACCQKYSGATRANPATAAPYQGWWREEGEEEEKEPSIDYHTYVFILVRDYQTNEALAFFDEWEKKLAKKTEQKKILVTYHPVKTRGNYI